MSKYLWRCVFNSAHVVNIKSPESQNTTIAQVVSSPSLRYHYQTPPKVYFLLIVLANIKHYFSFIISVNDWTPFMV